MHQRSPALAARRSRVAAGLCKQLHALHVTSFAGKQEDRVSCRVASLQLHHGARSRQRLSSAEGFAQLMTELPDVLGAPPAILRLDPLRMSLQEQVLSEDLTF